MLEEKKILVYPYSRDSYALVSYLRSKKHEEDIYVIAPGERGIVGSDAGRCFNLPLLEIKVENDFYTYMEKTDIVVVVWSKMNEELMKKIELYVLDALQRGKKVICCTILAEEFLGILSKKTYMGEFVYVPAVWKQKNRDSCIESGDFYRTKVPVIFIGELVAGLENFEILEKITECFRQTGYRVSGIGDKCYSELMEINRIPEMVIAGTIREEGKVNLFNQYVRRIEKKENPDLILVQLPGAIMKYDDKQTESFGIVPFLLSQAVKADYMLMCVPYDVINDELYGELKNICQYRLGTELCGICMSNAMMDTLSSVNVSGQSFLNVSQKKLNVKIDEILRETDIPVFNCYNERACMEICRNLIELLES